MALLGEAFVRVRPDTDGFEHEASGKIGNGLRRVAGAVTAAFGAIKVGGFLKDAIAEASDYSETVSKSANVFGAKLAPAIQAFAATAPRAFGISETAALAATAQFGNMFKQLGFTGDAAAKASTGLIKTAADLGSFNNVDPSDVLERIGASLRGEFDSLQQLIPNINAARVEHEALAETGKKTAKELTAQEKATATLAIIQKDGALAANDFAETSGGLANQQRILTATVDTLQRRLGEAFLPTATRVVTFLADNAGPAFDKVSLALGVFRDGLTGTSTPLIEFNPRLLAIHEAGVKVRDLFERAAPIVQAFITQLRGGDFSATGSSLASLADSAGKLGPVVRDLVGSIPSFNTVLTVGSTVLREAADHADLLGKAVPFLAAGFVLFKIAQLASNVAATVSIPLRLAEVVAQRAQTTAIRAQTQAFLENTGATVAAAAATGVETVAIEADTVASNTGILARIRGTVATVANTVAQTAASVATRAFAAAQIVLNAVLAANPIGLVIVAIAALVAGVVIAYQRSETFRTIVQAALGAVKDAYLTLAGVALTVVDKLLAGYQAIADAAGRLPGPLGAPFRAAAEAIGKVRDGVGVLQTTIEGLKGKDVKIDAKTGAAVQDVDSLGARIARLHDKTITLTTIEVQRVIREGQQATGRGLTARATGGPVRAGTPYLVGEFEPELFIPKQSGEILNQQQLAAAVGGRSAPVDLSPLLSEVAALRADIRALPRDYQFGQRQMALH